MTAGRPSIYTLELADRICERLAAGESMRSVARDPGMPNCSTMFKWIRENEEFSNQYAKAKTESADALVEDMLDIADNEAHQEIKVDGKLVKVKDGASVAHARLRVDTRKWAASKLKPKKYGEKIQQELTGKDGGAIEISETERTQRINRILNAARDRRVGQSDSGEGSAGLDAAGGTADDS